MDHLWKNELQVWAYKRPATGYPATRAQENWTRNYTYLLSSHYTHKVFYSLPNWYSFAAMVPEHSTHTYCRNTVYQNRSEPNHSEGSKTTFCYKVHFWNRFFFQLLSACCQSSPQTAGDCIQKSIFPDTLCELLTTASLLSGQRLHI